jgi:LysM repeat protein
MSRRSRNRRRPIVIAGVVMILAACTWWLWPTGGLGSGKGSADDSATEGSADTPVALATGDRDIATPPLKAQRPSGSASGSGSDSRTSTPNRRTTPDNGSPAEKPAQEPARPTTVVRQPSPQQQASKPDPKPDREADRAREPETPPQRTLATDTPKPARSLPAASTGDRTATRGTSARSIARVRAGLEMLDRNQPIEGRRALTAVLDSGSLDAATADQVRTRLAELNEALVFGPQIVPNDPFVVTYTVQSGDALSKIPRRMGVHTDWRFVQRINRIRRPEHIRAGQRLKLVTGPFHAVISKTDYRLDLYLDDGTERAFVHSVPVGLGEYNSTPEGRFRVRANSKLINPEWVNPRTRERYLPDDPANPIGEHWIGLVGDEEHLRDMHGYGIHGTIEPDSIGRQASMGCVRMGSDDVALVWEVLLDGVSTIEIRP